MPTGYTAAIEDGKITTGKGFLKHCLRAFGVFADYRDDKFTTDLPTRVFKVDSHYQENVSFHEKRLKDLLNKDDKYWEKTYKKQLKEAETAMSSDDTKSIKSLAAYEKIKKEIEGLSLSDDFKSIKDFAIKQITVSTSGDSKPLVGNDNYYTRRYKTLLELGVEGFKEEWLKSAKEDVVYYKERLEEETKRMEEKQAFLDKFLKEIDDFQPYEK